MCGAAFLVFAFAVVSSLIYGHSRLVWYPALAISYFLSWRGFRYYRVRYLFERAGPQSFTELRKLVESAPHTTGEARKSKQHENVAQLLSH